ncbi:ANTAR domain-containing protein [Streptomyces kunmingensis]|uniref:ANTAR domain-containing protein n=1 Tax=Streptomyces kunmingensis TaxID=68225 RepID=A0ABU6C275_9ACTN|nr:ANTAR domain-containing protein [Streptomyces kunmingensis]MEB3958795.1 ANTAR domain-containing protein [Streptomyces kunmingensis]
MAVEMRLQAISMRVFAQDMRAGAPSIALCAPDNTVTKVEQSVHSAVLTEQVKGILATRFACTPDQALLLLHEHCRRTNLPLAVLAHQVAHHHSLSA